MDLALPSFLLSEFLLLFYFSLSSALEDNFNSTKCPSFRCGDLADIRFPFFNVTQPDCGFFGIHCDGRRPQITFGGKHYVIKNISYGEHRFIVQDREVEHLPGSKVCDFLMSNLTVSRDDLLQIRSSPNITFYKCKRDRSTIPRNTSLDVRNYTLCEGHNLYYTRDKTLGAQYLPSNCTIVEFPVFQSWKVWERGDRDLSSILTAGFALQWNIRPQCQQCFMNGGVCILDESNKSFKCQGDGKQHVKKVIIGVSVGVGAAVLAFLLLFLLSWYTERRFIPSFLALISCNIFLEPSSKRDLKKCRSSLPTHVFSYSELQRATNNFHPSKELGDGGFGTVYHGKLNDGRAVAVKRLYENYRRVEQFMNEVKILAQLRHQNLVSLYGCTSRHSRELLLVYEFIPNGTVADHLYDDSTRGGGLTWPIRMSIAIETADALAYLHAVEPQIIHRDVKTNNILLDKNFRVKVADFGLSRLLPGDVTHVSTAPQGTPGYVDPDYHKRYQLTDKSDVYSFGVVLVELISSKPAVDISRQGDEINLAVMAINKIRNHALHELVDPSLGFESNNRLRWMVTSTAELAFRCLQEEKEGRPTMVEVLESLKRIESEEYSMEMEGGRDTDGSQPLKNISALSSGSYDGEIDQQLSNGSIPLG